MKKILMFIFSLMIVPIIVKADMGAPSFYEYEAVVTVQGGINKSNSDCKTEIPYGEVVTVYYENGDYAQIYNEDADCEVKTKYLTPSDISSEDLLTEDIEKSTALFEGKSITLYKGPSKIFGIDKEKFNIPYGTIVDYYYFNDSFSYISYNGVSGWVYICDMNDMCPYGEVVNPFAVNNERRVIFFSPSKIKDFDGNIIEEIPRNTELTTKYIGEKTYVMYYDKIGYIDGVFATDYGDYYNSDNRKIIILKDMNIKFNGKNMLVKKGTTMDIKYRYISHIFDEYDEITSSYYNFFVDDGTNYGWIEDKSNNNSFAILFDNDNTVTLNSDITLYSDMNCSKVVGTLPKSAIINSKYYRYNELDELTDNSLYNTTIYIEGENLSGWVRVNNNDFSIDDIIDPNSDVVPDSNNKPTQSENSNKVEYHISAKELTLYAVLGAFVGALVTAVIIKLVNKKKETL